MSWKNVKGIKPNDPKPRKWTPLKKIAEGSATRFHNGIRIEYENEHYTAYAEFSEDRTAGLIMIVNDDQSARRDWREFQRIKNEIAGPGWVGYEVYPPEHEVVDPSNAFFIWCFKESKLPNSVGMNGPHYLSPEESFAPQRGLI